MASWRVSRGFPRSGLASFHKEYYYEFFGLCTHKQKNTFCFAQNKIWEMSLVVRVHAYQRSMWHQIVAFRANAQTDIYEAMHFLILNITNYYDRNSGLFHFTILILTWKIFFFKFRCGYKCSDDWLTSYIYEEFVIILMNTYICDEWIPSFGQQFS